MKLIWIIILVVMFPGVSRAEAKTPRDFSISIKPFNLSSLSISPIMDLNSAESTVSKLKSLRLSSLLSPTPLIADLSSGLGLLSITGGLRGMSYSLAGNYKMAGSSVSLNIKNISRSPIIPGHTIISGSPMVGSIAIKGNGATALIDESVAGLGNSTFGYSKHGMAFNLSRTNGKIASQAIITNRTSSVNFIGGGLEFNSKTISFGSHGISSLNVISSKSLNISGSNIGEGTRQIRLDYTNHGFVFHAREGLLQGMDISTPTFHGANIFIHGLGGATQGLDFHAPIGFFNIQGANIGGVGQTFSMAGNLPMTTKFLITQVMNGAAPGTSLSLTSSLGLRNTALSINSNTVTRTQLLNLSLPIFAGFKLTGQYSSGLTSSHLMSLLGSLGKTGSLSLVMQQIGMSSTSTLGLSDKWVGLNWNLSYSRIQNVGVFNEAVAGGFSGNLSKITTLSINCQRGLPSYQSSGWNIDTISFSNKINATNFITLSSTYNDSSAGASSVNISYDTEWR